MEKEENHGFEKFVKYSIDELKTLRDSYEQNIALLQSNHWINKYQNKVNFDIRKILVRITFFFMMVLIINFVFLFIKFNPFNINIKTLADESTIKNSVLYISSVVGNVLVIGTLIRLLDDGTKSLRRELSDIELILRNKISNVVGKKIILDTNTINEIEKGNVEVELFKKAKEVGYQFYVTHIQSDEISKCKDNEKRSKLFLFWTQIQPTVIPTESFILGKSRLGYAKLGDGNTFNDLIGDSKKPKTTNDALIAETAIKNNFILLTDDVKLQKKVKSNQGLVIDLKKFKEKVTKH